MTVQFIYPNWLHFSATEICERRSLLHAVSRRHKIKTSLVIVLGAAVSRIRQTNPAGLYTKAGVTGVFSASLSAACFLISIVHCCHGAIKMWGNGVSGGQAALQLCLTSTTRAAALQTKLIRKMCWAKNFMCWAGCVYIQYERATVWYPDYQWCRAWSRLNIMHMTLQRDLCLWTQTPPRKYWTAIIDFSGNELFLLIKRTMRKIDSTFRSALKVTDHTHQHL